MMTGSQKQRWANYCRGAGRIGHSLLRWYAHPGIRMEICWQHTTLRPPTATRPRKNSESRSTGCVTTGTSHLDGLPIRARPPEEFGPFGVSEIRECTKAKQRSQSGPGAAAWLRARPVDASSVIPAQEFLYAGRRHLRIEENSAATCPACGAVDANTRNARLCHRAGAQVNQHRPLDHATSRILKRMSVRHQMESGTPFNADKDLRMDVVIEKGGLRDASASDFRHKSMRIDVTYVDSEAGFHLRGGSVDQD